MSETKRPGNPRSEGSDVDHRLLATRLREAREYLELSQEEVARVLGVPRSAVSMIENGQRQVGALELKKLAKLYQRSIEYFTGKEATPPIPDNVRHLARKASKLTERDRQELLRFVEFLQTRGRR
jgi:transcriptional regulator with XRE-family HTH domain